MPGLIAETIPRQTLVMKPDVCDMCEIKFVETLKYLRIGTYSNASQDIYFLKL